MGVSPSHQACAGAAATLTPRGSKAGQVPRHSRAVLGQTVSAEDLLSVNRVFRGLALPPWQAI